MCVYVLGTKNKSQNIKIIRKKSTGEFFCVRYIGKRKFPKWAKYLTNTKLAQA